VNLLALVPTPYRWLAMLLAGLALIAFGFVKGAQHEEDAQAQRDLQAERGAAELVGRRQAVTARVDLKFAPALTQIRTVTKETIRYVPQFVRADDCPLPGGFRVFHDAAATGRIPDPAGIPDAAAVPAQDVAATVADNYGACLETAKRLDGLQEWIREQLNLHP
jgi:hypothetical protein